MPTKIPDVRANFAANLKHYRLALSMSQGDLAKKTGLQTAAISNFECGRRAPSLENLAIISKALGVSVHVMIFTPDKGR